MTRTFESPRSYDPSFSVLGRALRRWVDDRLRGEALFIVILTGLSLALLMGHYLGWALLRSVLAAAPAWQTFFWGGQAVLVLALIGIGLVGVRPAVRVRCLGNGVELRQADRSCTLPYTSLNRVDRISARRYHRHYRRYAATQVFVSVLPERVLCLHTDDGPVIVALSDPTAQTDLFNHLNAVCSQSAKPGECRDPGGE